MSELRYKKRKNLRSSVESKEKNREKRALITSEVMRSADPIDKLLIKAHILGLVSNVYYEEIEYHHYHYKKSGWFHSTTKDIATRRVRRVMTER